MVDAEMKELTLYEKDQSDSGQFLPVLSVDQAVERYEHMREFVSKCLVKDTDYGKIPGTKKNTLYKPGAEKLTTFFGLRVTFVDDGSVENWGDPTDLNEPFFYYKRKCRLWKGDVLIAEASGSANSKEGRYRWRWVKSDDVPMELRGTDLKERGGKDGIFRWMYLNRETTGQYGKPESYWKKLDSLIKAEKVEETQKKQHWDSQYAEYIEWESYEYRVPNDDIFTLVNTILKMAEKRALVAATLIGCNASDYFTQDMEDIQPGVETGNGNGFGVDPEVSQETIEEPGAAIANALDMIESETFTGNDYLALSKALDFDKSEVFEVKKKHEKDKGTDFPAAAKELIDMWNKVNG
jgi:hypothetical protein